MPKEVIQWPRTDHDSGTEMSVHWSKAEGGGYVQLGVTRHVWGRVEYNPDLSAAPPHADHGACDECVKTVARFEEEEQSGRLQMMIADTTDAPPRGEWDRPATVFTEVMSRDEINRMIRALRRARDQAYGADA